MGGVGVPQRQRDVFGRWQGWFEQSFPVDIFSVAADKNPDIQRESFGNPMGPGTINIMWYENNKSVGPNTKCCYATSDGVDCNKTPWASCCPPDDCPDGHVCPRLGCLHGCIQCRIWECEWLRSNILPTCCVDWCTDTGACCGSHKEGYQCLSDNVTEAQCVEDDPDRNWERRANCDDCEDEVLGYYCSGCEDRACISAFSMGSCCYVAEGDAVATCQQLGCSGNSVNNPDSGCVIDLIQMCDEQEGTFYQCDGNCDDTGCCYCGKNSAWEPWALGCDCAGQSIEQCCAVEDVCGTGPGGCWGSWEGIGCGEFDYSCSLAPVDSLGGSQCDPDNIALEPRICSDDNTQDIPGCGPPPIDCEVGSPGNCLDRIELGCCTVVQCPNVPYCETSPECCPSGDWCDPACADICPDPNDGGPNSCYRACRDFGEYTTEHICDCIGGTWEGYECHNDIGENTGFECESGLWFKCTEGGGGTYGSEYSCPRQCDVGGLALPQGLVDIGLIGLVTSDLLLPPYDIFEEDGWQARSGDLIKEIDGSSMHTVSAEDRGIGPDECDVNFCPFSIATRYDCECCKLLDCNGEVCKWYEDRPECCGGDCEPCGKDGAHGWLQDHHKLCNMPYNSGRLNNCWRAYKYETFRTAHQKDILTGPVDAFVGCDGTVSQLDICEANTRGYHAQAQTFEDFPYLAWPYAPMCDNGVGPYYLKCGPGEPGRGCEGGTGCADGCHNYGQDNIFDGNFTCNMCDGEHYGAVVHCAIGDGWGVCPRYCCYSVHGTANCACTDDTETVCQRGCITTGCVRGWEDDGSYPEGYYDADTIGYGDPADYDELDAQERYVCCTHAGRLSQIWTPEFFGVGAQQIPLIGGSQCHYIGGNYYDPNSMGQNFTHFGGNRMVGGRSATAKYSYTYSCIFDPTYFNDNGIDYGHIRIVEQEAYRLHKISCTDWHGEEDDIPPLTQPVSNKPFLAPSQKQGCADGICEYCDTAVGDECTTISGVALANLSQNAKIFLMNRSTVGGPNDLDSEFMVNLQGYWGELTIKEPGNVDENGSPLQQHTTMPIEEGRGWRPLINDLPISCDPCFPACPAYAKYAPFSKSCIMESVSHHIDALVKNATRKISNGQGVLSLTPHEAMAAAMAYYGATVNFNFVSVLKTFKHYSTGWWDPNWGSGSRCPGHPNKFGVGQMGAEAKTRATIADYSSVIELPYFISFLNRTSDRISPLLGRLTGLTVPEGSPYQTPKPWSQNLESPERNCDDILRKPLEQGYLGEHYPRGGGNVIDRNFFNPLYPDVEVIKSWWGDIYPHCLVNGEPIPHARSVTWRGPDDNCDPDNGDDCPDLVCHNTCPRDHGDEYKPPDFTIGDFIDVDGRKFCSDEAAYSAPGNPGGHNNQNSGGANVVWYYPSCSCVYMREIAHIGGGDAYGPVYGMCGRRQNWGGPRRTGACCYGANNSCEEVPQYQCDITNGYKFGGAGTLCDYSNTSSCDTECEGYGMIKDCDGTCVPGGWLMDGYCDDGTYTYNGNPINLACGKFACDLGDCCWNTAYNVEHREDCCEHSNADTDCGSGTPGAQTADEVPGCCPCNNCGQSDCDSDNDGVCCDGFGICNEGVTQNYCENEVWAGVWTDQTSCTFPAITCDPVGACCLIYSMPPHGCEDITQAACENWCTDPNNTCNASQWQGALTNCHNACQGLAPPVGTLLDSPPLTNPHVPKTCSIGGSKFAFSIPFVDGLQSSVDTKFKYKEGPHDVQNPSIQEGEKKVSETMFGSGPIGGDCLPSVPWHNPCSYGPDGTPWASVPTLLLAAAAFPEIMDCIPASHLDGILDKCAAGLYFASGDLRDTASASGFSNVWDYLIDIDAKTRYKPGTPRDRSPT